MWVSVVVLVRAVGNAPRAYTQIVCKNNNLLLFLLSVSSDACLLIKVLYRIIEESLVHRVIFTEKVSSCQQTDIPASSPSINNKSWMVS